MFKVYNALWKDKVLGHLQTTVFYVLCHHLLQFHLSYLIPMYYHYVHVYVKEHW